MDKTEKRQRILRIMNFLNNALVDSNIEKMDSTELIDAHINLAIQYCKVMGVDPKILMRTTLNVLEEDNTMMINGVKLEWEQ